MKIKKKVYTNADSNYPGYMCNFFSTAAELLGSEWEYKASTPGVSNYEGPSLRKKTPAGYYGWIGPTNTPANPLKASIAGTIYDTSGGQLQSVPSGSGDHTCVVWEGDGGSVGIGEEKDSRLLIRLIMAKFDGQYGGNAVYALGNGVEYNNNRSLLGYNGARIENGINMSTIVTGVGVYLHPLLEPTTGLTCPDVFGVQCYDSTIYATRGTIVKQGGVSYMSVLGSHNGTLENILFIKT